MQWEQLPAPEFAKAVRQTGVCVVSMGVLEKHSEHLPVGTDVLNGHRVVCMAAEKEPAVVFPPFYFGQINEARCYPGCLTVKPALLIDLIQNVCDEIGRNGFRKIILCNGHGGNGYLLPLLAQCSLWEEKPYQIYVTDSFTVPGQEAEWQAVLDTKVHGHGCECETSIMLANYPELVRMDRVPRKPALPLKRLAHLKSLYTGIWWYGDNPDHYAGDARRATAAKGKILRAMLVNKLAKYIRIVKKDKGAMALSREFFRRERALRGRA